MAVDLSRVKEREALSPRREPYWQRLRPGCFLGFRPSARGGAGTWIARTYSEDECAYRLKALGDFGELPGKEQFAAAKKEAERIAQIIEAAAKSVPLSGRSPTRAGPSRTETKTLTRDSGAMSMTIRSRG